MLQHWRANVDLQVTVDVLACARYLTKYAAKGEPRSNPVSVVVYLRSIAVLLDSSDTSVGYLRHE